MCSGSPRAGAGSDRAPLLDAGIIATGTASALWIIVVNPALVGIVDPLAAAVSIAYPVLDIALLALALRIVLTTRQSPPPLKLLALGIGAYFVADVVYAVQLLQGTGRCFRAGST